MNIISVLHFSSFIANMLLITLVLSRKSGALLNRICALLIATFAFWSLFSGLYAMAGTNEEATLLLNISAFGWCFTPVVSLWFYLALANKENILKNKAFLAITILVAVGFTYAQWSGNMISENIQAAWGWTGIWKLSMAAYAFYIYYFAASGACLYLIIYFGRKAKTNHQKKQAKLLIITGTTALVLATITDVVFRVVDIRAVPDVADIFFMIWGVGIVYAVSKYGLMSLTPTVAAETILSTISDSIILLDIDAQIVYTNRATTALLESTDNELNGTSFRSVVQDKKAADDLLEETLQAGNCKNHELSYLSKNGKTIPVLVSTSVVHDSDNNMVGSVISAKDITDRKKAEAALQKTMEELRYSNNELQEFAYIASHDLQEPLRMVSSYVQLLEKRYTDSLDADAHDFINFAVAGVKRMQSLINNILQYSRVGTRGKPFENTECQDVYDSAVSNLEVAIKESGASVSHGNLPQVWGDGGQLTQVFQNLIGNAIKYHNEKPPEVSVDAEQKNGNWVFSVKDNGIGIDPKFFDRIFVIFQRLHGGEYAGTGVGLSIARKIVQRHGGQIWVESNPGGGSIFYFTIPSGKKGGN